MKKILLSAGLLAVSAAAFAADYGSAGCGLGSLVFKENDGTQILAATTNATFGNQTFGITFGTSNCNAKGMIKVSMARESYIEANYKDLSREAAAGKGEYVASLASLYGYTPENSPKFAQLLQKNHTAIFAAINRLVAAL
jgi:hypothetical protein